MQSFEFGVSALELAGREEKKCRTSKSENPPKSARQRALRKAKPEARAKGYIFETSHDDIVAKAVWKKMDVIP